MKKVLLYLAACFALLPIMAQDTVSIMRKGSCIVGQDGVMLTEQNLRSLLDDNAYNLYEKGHRKMAASTTWYAVAGGGLAVNCILDVLTIAQIYGLQIDYFDSMAEAAYLTIQAVPFLVAASAGLIAHTMHSKGRQMIDDVCEGWNGRKNARDNVSLSFSASPAAIGLTLNF